jgi:hypothetical protein
MKQLTRFGDQSETSTFLVVDFCPWQTVAFLVADVRSYKRYFF